MSFVNFSTLIRKVLIFPLILSLSGCNMPNINLDSGSSVSVKSGSAEDISPMLDNLAKLLPSDDAGIVVGYINGENLTIASVGNPSFTEETLFEYGSITKVLTANILMQLVNEGSLRLDDNLNQYLPADIQDKQWETVTLRQLATHTAGIPFLPPNLSSAQIDQGDDPFANYDGAMLYQGIKATTVSSVGEKWAYSNFGYAILGLILRQKTNLVYADLVEQRLFDPLGMDTATIEGWSSINIAPPLTSSGAEGTQWTLNSFESAGAFKGSILDGVSFLKASMSACLNNDLIALSNCQTQQPTGIKIDETSQMGLGWVRNSGDNGIVIWHNGSTGGYTTFLGFNPEKHVGIVLLSNVAMFQSFADGTVVNYLLSIN